MNVEAIASQSSVILVYSMTEETQFPGFIFLQVVQRQTVLSFSL